MTDDIQYPDGRTTTSTRSKRASTPLDALHGGDLSRAYVLLDEARETIERAQHDDTKQAYREIAYDCYD